MQKVLQLEDPITNSLNPTCTGTSVFAVAYDKGVVIASDRVVSYGKSARYHNFTRQYKVNNEILIAFSGDHADFQHVQNVIERQVMKWKQVGQDMTPRALHTFLTNLFYNKRSKMDPLWNNLIVAGVESDAGNRPFIGIITQRGVAYQAKHVANGMGAFLLNQLIETEWRKKSEATTRQEAEAIVRKAIELAIYHDCVADNTFEVNYVDVTDGVHLGKAETTIGDWALAETNCQYE